MMGYQTGDNGVRGRGRVTTLTSHQSEILHSLIFNAILLVLLSLRVARKEAKISINTDTEKYL